MVETIAIEDLEHLTMLARAKLEDLGTEATDRDVEVVERAEAVVDSE